MHHFSFFVEFSNYFYLKFFFLIFIIYVAVFIKIFHLAISLVLIFSMILEILPDIPFNSELRFPNLIFRVV